MNIYDRIINILLEARIEDYVERLDELARYQKEIEKGNLSDNAVRRLRRAELKGNLDKPNEVHPGRISHLAKRREKERSVISNLKKQKKWAPKMSKPAPESQPKGPGKQTGPLEKRGLKVKPQ